MYVAPNNVSGRVVKTFMSLRGGVLANEAIPCHFRLFAGLLREPAESANSLAMTIGNAISAPSLLPIQFRCMCLIGSGQSKSSKCDNKRSGYEPFFPLGSVPVTLKNHCSKFFWMTLLPQRSQLPSMTCSFAKTVWQSGHQFTGASLLYASPAL